MPTEDTYSSVHLALFYFENCVCSYVGTNISHACLVSGLLSFENPAVLLFYLSDGRDLAIWLPIDKLYFIRVTYGLP